MHVHLPKPLHGWRAFVGEVGIIVLGVLIALGAEQLVEDWQWRHKVAMERSALNFEVQDNLNGIQSRLVLEPCVQRRLGELGRLLEQVKTGALPPLIGPIGVPLSFGGAKGAWNIAASGDVLPHMPLKEQLAYSNAFDNFRTWDELAQGERNAWIRLGVLDRPGHMTDADWAGVREAYAQATATDAVVRIAGPFIFRTANAGLRPDPPQKALKALEAAEGGEEEICRPIIATAGRKAPS